MYVSPSIWLVLLHKLIYHLQVLNLDVGPSLHASRRLHSIVAIIVIWQWLQEWLSSLCEDDNGWFANMSWLCYSKSWYNSRISLPKSHVQHIQTPYRWPYLLVAPLQVWQCFHVQALCIARYKTMGEYTASKPWIGISNLPLSLDKLTAICLHSDGCLPLDLAWTF